MNNNKIDIDIIDFRVDENCKDIEDKDFGEYIDIQYDGGRLRIVVDGILIYKGYISQDFSVEIRRSK